MVSTRSKKADCSKRGKPAAEPAPPTVIGLRARQSDERRKRLVRAAKALLTEADGSAFSMPVLAERAGVSLATPYNLFGSKAAILHAVFEAEVASLHGSVRGARMTDPIERLMSTSDRIAAVFQAKPGFYRGLSRELMALGPDETQRLVLPLAEGMITPFLDFLEEEDVLPSYIPANLVKHQLQRTLEILMLHWVTLNWAGARLRVELRVALSTTLLAYVNDALRPRLAAILKSAAKELAAHYKTP